VGALRKQLSESTTAFRDVFANADLRRLELAWAGSIIGHWAYAVALAVFAFQKGGATTVGIVFLIRMIPSGIVSPFAAMLADRYRREAVMLASDLVRVALTAAAAAAVFADTPPELVYVLAVLIALAATPFRPAQAAISPSLAQTPNELTAANVVSSAIESLGFFIGPALAGLLLAVASTGVVFLVTAGSVLWSAFFVSRIRTASGRRESLRAEGSTIVSEAFAGARATLEDGKLRVLVGMLTAQTLVAGALNVLTVVTALRLLHLHKSGVGFLNSSFGVGALVGAIAAFSLIGRRRLSPSFIVGILLWGAPLALVGVWPQTALALLLFGLVGAGNTLVDVAGFTLIQRAVPEHVLARVFGVLEMLYYVSAGLGAIIAAPLVNGLGARASLIIVGAFLPVLVAVVGPRLMTIDAEAEAPDPAQLALLRSIPIFAPLPGAPLEHLAARLIPLSVEPGTIIVKQGDPGDRFYIIVEGQVEVEVDGQRSATLGPGDHFGEIALLRDVPRTATVAAATPVVLYALEREDFLSAVTSHVPSSQAAQMVVDARLHGLAADDARRS
jgi:MFS family permease